MPWIDVNGHDIYYTEGGNPQGQPFVFLHGNSSCGEAWWQQFAYFGEKCRVIAYDSVNHGHSSNSPRDEEEPDRTDELEGFLAAMGISRPILAGNSMGGATIQRWAARHPGDAAALVVSGMGVAAAGQAGWREAKPLDLETLFLPIGDSLTEKYRKDVPLMFERYLRIRSTATRIEALRHPRERSAKTVKETHRLNETIPAVTSPLLAIIGSADALIPPANAARLHALVPGSKYVLMEGAPHNAYWECAAEWNAHVAAFLADAGV